MIRLDTCNGAGEVRFDAGMTALPEDVTWIDLVRPEPDEVAAVERLAGVRLPLRQTLVEIEKSSRLSTHNGAVQLSATALHLEGDVVDPTPIGFVLTPRILVSIRYEDLKSFEEFHATVADPHVLPRDSVGVFVGLQELFVDRAADVLEQVGAELDAVSQRIFRARESGSAKGRLHGQTEQLSGTLKQVGRNGDLVSQIRDNLLGNGRMIPYVMDNAADWLSPVSASHLKTVREDIGSLNDYVLHLEGKVQFLLDATLGLTNIEQNNIFRVLTVVSVVGIPPTFLASLYGMNFKHMPELEWDYGYPYGLTLILLSAIIPLILFKLRGWL